MRMSKVITVSDWVEAGNTLEEIAPHAVFAFANSSQGMEPLRHRDLIKLEPDEIVDDYWFKAYVDAWLETFDDYVCDIDGSRLVTGQSDTILVRLRDESGGLNALERKISEIIKEKSKTKSYYVIAGNETLPIAEELGYTKGSALRHIVRAGKKPGVSELDDLKVARGFLDMHISKLEGVNED